MMEDNKTTQSGEYQKSNEDKTPKKKNKNKKKRTGGDGDNQVSVTSDALALPNSGNIHQNISLKDLKMAMEVLNLQQKPAKTTEEALHKSYQFWSTQPVPKMYEKIITNEPIEPPKPPEEIRSEPYTLPDGFQWDTLNLNEPLVLKELYTLLNENYVEDDDCMFRFDYQTDFLKWALQPPGWRMDWHCGVRVIKSSRLVGFISAIPATIRIYDHIQTVVEINFLCVHKKLRAKRVAPVLIREITRRVNLTGIFQGVYTAGIVLPKPIATCRYWHRSLNPKKLIDIKFSHLPTYMTMQRTLKRFKLPELPKTPGFRKMEPKDSDEVVKLLNDYLLKFDLVPIFSEEDFKHWFVTQLGIIDSFVVEASDGSITDFVSYYTLPSTVVYHPVHKVLKAAYSFYNVSTKTPWVDLMLDALITARNSGFDVFNALDLMDNKEFLEPLKFGIGDGNLQYYLYNWKCPSITPNKIGPIIGNDYKDPCALFNNLNFQNRKFHFTSKYSRYDAKLKQIRSDEGSPRKEICPLSTSIKSGNSSSDLERNDDT